MVCAHELGLAERFELVRSVAATLKPNARLMRGNPMSKILTLVLGDGLLDGLILWRKERGRAVPLAPVLHASISERMCRTSESARGDARLLCLARYRLGVRPYCRAGKEPAMPE